MLSNRTTVPSAVSVNLETAARLLARFRSEGVRHFIAGRPDSGDGQTFDNLNPTDNTVLCQVAAGSAGDID
jgi:5-carboxymethyl-2-hydroxymuconic-semialdehyde dehydrogenase